MPLYKHQRSSRKNFIRAIGLPWVVFAFGVAPLPVSGQEASEANPETLYRLAVTSLERGIRYEQAIKNLRAACEKDPKNYHYFVAQGYCRP